MQWSLTEEWDQDLQDTVSTVQLAANHVCSGSTDLGQTTAVTRVLPSLLVILAR